MRTIVLATRNAHKLIEIRSVLEDLAIVLEALPASAPEVIEDGSTFSANAVKKAESAAAHVRGWALADDSGIEVDALDGAPGVRSARYAGVDGTGADAANRQLLLTELATVPDERRSARFRCVLALARPGRPTVTFTGAIEGRITRAPRGDAGFGYDPLFYYPPFDCTLAEVSLARKNTVSHRARALAAMRAEIEALLSDPTDSA